MLAHKEASRDDAILSSMADSGGIVAHMIVGAKPEVYLASALDSIADICDHLVVNDTSGIPRSVNASALELSRFAREGRLTLVESAFRDFATARNGCIDATPAQFSAGWALVIDADEVHGKALENMSALLPKLHEDIHALDGYVRNFVGSFSWWIEISRRRCFFRLKSGARWRNKVHEQLEPIRRRVALPVSFFHYGHVVTPREEAEKGRLYASLGQADPAPTEKQIEQARPDTVWPLLLRRASRFTGSHPPAALATIAALSRERADIFAQVDALAARQTPLERLRNNVRRLNTERLLTWRAAEAWLRWGWKSTPSDKGSNAGASAQRGLEQTRDRI